MVPEALIFGLILYIRHPRQTRMLPGSVSRRFNASDIVLQAIHDNDAENNSFQIREGTIRTDGEMLSSILDRIL